MKTRRQWHFPKGGLLWFFLGLALIPEITAQRQRNKLNKRPGIIEGVVLYQPDPGRRWQQQTYYLRKPETGELAQAVVTLQAKGKPMRHKDTGRPNKVVEMDQVNFRFVPDTISIQSGDFVEFKNSDEALHNVMNPTSSNPFNINLPRKGSRHLQKFETAGGLQNPLRISCLYHVAMRGWIFVFNHPYHQVTDTDGRFRLVNIPAGEYELALRHAAGNLEWSKTITIKAGRTSLFKIRLSPDNLGQSKQ
jgi:plastocyanin